MDNCIYSSLIASCRFLLLEKIFENHDEYSCFLFFSKNPKYRKIPRMNPHIKLKEGLCEYLLGVLVANSLFVVRFAIWYHLYNLKNVKNIHERVLLLVASVTFLHHLCVLIL